MTWNQQEDIQWKNISSTPAQFWLRGGRYGLLTQASSRGSATLQRLSPDGSTLINVLTAITANGYATVDLPQGLYTLTLSGVTAFYGELTSIVQGS